MFDWISKLFKPAADLVDELVTSDEERGKLQNELAKIQMEANKQFLELAKLELDARTEAIKAEAASSHWLQGNWRPLCSIALVSIVVLDSFGIVLASDALYTLATAFLGLYGAGRSVEKAAATVKLGKKPE